jgi:hypothetical protein
MKALTNSEMLDLWDRGARLHPLDQALVALAAAMPKVTYHDLTNWPVGRRNRALAALRTLCFGPELRVWTACGQCGEKLEFELDCRELVDPDGSCVSDGLIEADVTGHVVVDDRAYRLPTSRDLAAVADIPDLNRAARGLVERCRMDGEPVDEMGDEEIDKIGAKLAFADPSAEIRITLRCPGCCAEWDETLDLVSFVWTEIDSLARQVLSEVHTLASAYGWTERQVLGLSAERRRRYVEMVQH